MLFDEKKSEIHSNNMPYDKFIINISCEKKYISLSNITPNCINA